jgi:ankyrin repeat protein
MPTELTDMYDKAIERIQEQPRPYATLALRVLSWISCAKRPLLVEELRHGLAVEFGKPFLDRENLCDARSMVMVCGGLVTIDSESNTIRLVHFTIQEYFRSLTSGLFANAEVEISRACLTYLLFDAFATGACEDDDSLDARVQGYPFLRYAAQHWGDHLRGAPEHELKDTAIMFLQDKYKSSCATQIEYRPCLGYPGSSQAYNKCLTALHTAANWGLAWLVQCLLLESGVEIDTPDFDGRRSLHKPCREGHEAVVHILLENGADMSLQDHYGRTALRWAVDGGKVTIVQLLLKKGADINALVDYHGGTALHWAARTGNETIVETLLNGGANMAARCYDGQTPLQYAIQGGYEAIVRVLLERGANKAEESRSMQTALHRAAQSGKEEEVMRLVGEGVDVGSLAEGGTTALHLAAFAGHQKIVKFLLERGADALAASEDKRTALIRGVEGGHEEVVRLLLEHGADPEARDCYGRMAVHWAARSGYEAVMILLLDYKADITAEDTYGRTALRRAAESKQEGMVELLMSRTVSQS